MKIKVKNMASVIASIPSKISISGPAVEPVSARGPLSDHCDASFKQSYESTIRSLNNAKASHDRIQRKFTLNLDTLKPENTKKCMFWKHINPDVAECMKMLYDISVTGRAGLLDVLYYLCYEYKTCVYIDMVGINKYHICDMRSCCSGKLQLPDAQAEWDKLLVFTQSLIHSKKLDAKVMFKHKRTKTRVHQGASSYNQSRYEGWMMTNDQNKLGIMAGCFVWMLETKNMNRAYNVQNSCSGTYQYNESTLLCRRKPIVQAEAPVQSDPNEVETKEPSAEEVEVTAFPEVDNWEDLLDEDFK